MKACYSVDQLGTQWLSKESHAMSAMIESAKTEWPILALYGVLIAGFTIFLYRWEILRTVGNLCS